ncbi:MAG: serine/threonine protein kinase, partial [Caldiserica bacterium]|nr:serine/threonine protein kinase [Caldisericota bacterium]
MKKYKLLEPLASGGMATVYLAKNLATDEIVVAKIPNFSGLPNRDKLEKRFLREAQILSRIHSKYVVKIHDFGQDENTQEYFLILEYLHGKTLEEICAKDKLPIPTIVDIATQISEVLGDLYSQGIVHRDIKSSNIKITSEGNIKLFDFGISKGGDLPAMTRSTDFLGTIQYMSPEQTEGSEVDIRSDIYSLGIVIYEMLFQKLPFDAPSPVEVLEMQRKKEPKIPPEARDRNIPASMLAVMFRCMEKQPDRRFQTPSELMQALNLVSEEFGISTTEREELRKTRLTSVAALG